MPHKPKLPGLRRSAQPFVPTYGDSNKHPIKKPGDALSDVNVAARHWIERARVECQTHRIALTRRLSV